MLALPLPPQAAPALPPPSLPLLPAWLPTLAPKPSQPGSSAQLSHAPAAATSVMAAATSPSPLLPAGSLLPDSQFDADLVSSLV